MENLLPLMINGWVARELSFRTQLGTTVICSWLMCTWLHVVEAVARKEKTNSIMSCKQSLSDSIFRHQTDTSNIASTLFKCLLLCPHRSIHVLSATFVTNDCQTNNDMTEFSKKKCFQLLIDFSFVRCFVKRALNLYWIVDCSLAAAYHDSNRLQHVVQVLESWNSCEVIKWCKTIIFAINSTMQTRMQTRMVWYGNSNAISNATSVLGSCEKYCQLQLLWKPCRRIFVVGYIPWK